MSSEFGELQALAEVIQIGAAREGFPGWAEEAGRIAQRAKRLAQLIRELKGPEHFVKSKVTEMLETLGCTSDQLARSPNEITPDTRAYVGPLVNYDNRGQIVRIFDLLPEDIEHVYTSYPEGRIIFQDVRIGDKTPQKLETELDQKGIIVGEDARYLLRSRKFAESIPEKPEIISTARIRVGQLDFPEDPTTDQIYERIEALGGEICPAVVGPQKRIEDADQPLGDGYCIAMRQIADRYGDLRVFYLERRGGGLRLSRRWAGPTHEWRPGDGFVFSLRKKTLNP